MNLGSKIRLLREAAGLTQTELAQRAGMTQQAVASMERRDSSSSKFTVLLAVALGKTVAQLLDDDVDLGSSALPSHFIDADEVINLIKLYKLASQQGRRQIMASATAAHRDD